MNPKSIGPSIVAGSAGALLAIWLPAFIAPSQADTKLLPFQGRLTDAAGIAVPDGARVVEFKLYDAPTGGNLKWAGEVHKLSVNGGIVNTMLGSKADLKDVDFNTPSYLQITVDAQAAGQAGNGVIDAADPPLLPRQSVVPAVFASESGNSRKLNGADWSSILLNGSNDPNNGFMRGDKLAPGSVGTAQLGTGSVTSSQMAQNAVTSNAITDGSIQPSDLSVPLQQAIIPTGTVVAYAVKDFNTMPAPAGWAYCDGSSVLRTDPTYAALFTVIGVSHGSADATGALDSNRFNLPDYRGRFLRMVAYGTGAVGRDPNRADRFPMNPGGATAANVGSVQDDQFASHTHKYFDRWTGSNGNATVESGNGFPRNNTEETTGPTGGDETRPKNAYVMYIIKL